MESELIAPRRKMTARKSCSGIGRPRKASVAVTSPHGGKKFSISAFKKRNDPDGAKNKVQKRKNKYYVKILREIKIFQHTTDLLMPKRPFVKLVREILQKFAPSGSEFRIQASALEALQEAAEAYLVTYLEDSNLCVVNTNRVTTMLRDLALVKRIRGES